MDSSDQQLPNNNFITFTILVVAIFLFSILSGLLGYLYGQQNPLIAHRSKRAVKPAILCSAGNPCITPQLITPAIHKYREIVIPTIHCLGDIPCESLLPTPTVIYRLGKYLTPTPAASPVTFSPTPASSTVSIPATSEDGLINRIIDLIRT